MSWLEYGCVPERMATFGKTYNDILEFLTSDTYSDNWQVEVNERTKAGIRAIRGPISFNVPLHRNLVPVPFSRRVFPRTAAAEVAWFLQGVRTLDFLHEMGIKIWDQFAVDADPEEIGSEAGRKILTSAYGYRWRKHFGRDQLLEAIQTLSHDKTNRQVLVSAWDPAIDGLANTGKQTNVPCPAFFQLTRFSKEGRDQLAMAVYIRSSDVFVGLPYDMMGYAFLLDMLSHELKCKPSHIHMTLGHAHLYASHYTLAKRCTIEFHRAKRSDGLSAIELSLPGWTLSEVSAQPREYVHAVQAASRGVQWPEYNPTPEVIL